MWTEKPRHVRLQNDEAWCGFCARVRKRRRMDRHIESCRYQSLDQPPSPQANPQDLPTDPIANYFQAAGSTFPSGPDEAPGIS